MELFTLGIGLGKTGFLWWDEPTRSCAERFSRAQLCTFREPEGEADRYGGINSCWTNRPK